jgi:hypothetical protein
MIAPGNSIIQILLALAFVVASGYASGRIHQWYKHGLERDHAYREGYDQASQSMFDMVTRSGPRRAAGEVPFPARAARPAGHINERRSSRYTTSDIETGGTAVIAAAPVAPELVGTSRRRIVAHPVTTPAGKRRRHAA